MEQRKVHGEGWEGVGNRRTVAVETELERRTHKRGEWAEKKRGYKRQEEFRRQ